MSFVLEAVGTFLFSRGYYPLIEQKRRKTGPYCFFIFNACAAFL